MALLSSLLPSFARSSNQCEGPAVTSTVRPTYQVEEQENTFTLTVQLPGVAKTDLNVTDEEGTLTVRGERAWKQPDEWSSVYRETRGLPFSLSLYHDNVVNAEKAQAELKDGVLTLTLPKSEARKPRKITVA